MVQQVCQSAYGTYIRGATTVAARYIGHPAVTIPASEMVKTMMDEVAPPINKYCVIHTEQKQKIETNDIVQIAQIYKNAIEETKQYLKDKKLYIPTVNDYLLTGYNGTIQSVQYLMDKYCPELGETLDNIKAKKAEMISYFYENNRQIYIKNPEIGTVFDKMLFDVPIDEKNMNVFEKAEVAMDGVASGFIKDIASGANAIVDMALSPLDTAEALTSPGALTIGTIWNGLTEDVVNDWKKGTIQGKTEAVGRTISIVAPIEILKAAGIIGKGTKVAGTLGKTANVVDTAVDVAKRATDVADPAIDITKGIADVANPVVDLTKKITDAGDTAVDITKGLEEAKDGLANTGKNFTDNITKKFESTNSAKKPSIGIDDVLQQKPDKIPEQKPKEVPKQKPNETPEQNTKKLSETDDIITVEKGNSGVNGHNNVEFSGEKPNSNINDVKDTGEKVKNEIISKADRKKLNSWENKISDELYLKHKNVFDNPKYYDQKTGWPIWPGQNGDPNIDGFLNGKYTNEMLQPGQTLDRYGGNNGTFFGDIGTPISNRAMSPDSNFSLYNQYKVTRELPVRKGEIAPWFDEPGGGTQYMLDPDFVKEIKEIQKSMKTRKDFIDVLIEMGYLERL